MRNPVSLIRRAAHPGESDRACPACGASMMASQDWCLECGTAAPGRLSQQHGWKLGAAVLVATLGLVGAASVAGYAAVTGEAERETLAQATQAQAPATASVPAPPAPAAPTSTPPKVETPPTSTADRPPPSSPSFDDGSDGRSPGTSPNSPTPTTPSADPLFGGGQGTTPSTPTERPRAVLPLRASSLSVYDPYRRAGAEFGDPADALGATEPYFDVTVPADGENIGTGLEIDLGAAKAVTQIKFRTTTTRVGLEVYGVAQGRPRGLKTGWRQLPIPPLEPGARDVTLTLLAPATVRRLVLFFTTPGNVDDPRAVIGELQILN